jgi:putative PIN family toxin of toxin-antitoxin system
LRAVIDTNVTISALITAGSPPDRVLRALLAERFDAVTSPQLIAELEDVASRRKFLARVRLAPAELRLFLDTIHAHSAIVRPDFEVSAMQSDPADNRVLEAAVAGNADYIVTGDGALLALGEYEGVEIVTPAMFIAILESGL